MRTEPTRAVLPGPLGTAGGRPREDTAHLADEVQQQLALGAHQAGEQLRDPRQPLDGGHADAVLVHGVRQRVLVIIETQKPQHLRRRTSFSSVEF